MKTKLLLFVVAFSFLLVGFRGLPCVQATHDCCKPITHLTISDLYQKCCDGEQTNATQTVSSSQKNSESAVTMQVAVSIVQPFSSQTIPSFFSAVPKSAASKTPAYLDHAHLLL